MAWLSGPFGWGVASPNSTSILKSKRTGGEQWEKWVWTDLCGVRRARCTRREAMTYIKVAKCCFAMTAAADVVVPGSGLPAHGDY
jgi:hypothetical protein